MLVYLIGLHDVHCVHSSLLQDSLILQQRPHRLFHPAHTQHITSLIYPIQCDQSHSYLVVQQNTKSSVSSHLFHLFQHPTGSWSTLLRQYSKVRSSTTRGQHKQDFQGQVL